MGIKRKRKIKQALHSGRPLQAVLSLFQSHASFSCVAVFGVEPDMIRDGSTIPVAKIFQDVIQKSVLMMPLGAVDDGEHSQNEKINR